MTKGAASNRAVLRRKSREFALQALYQWHVSQDPAHHIEAQFLAEKPATSFDTEFFSALLNGVVGQFTDLDQMLAPLLKRSPASVDPIEKNILRLGALELKDHPEIPFRVVLNEYVELVKVFGGVDGHRFVNSVLDRLVRELRSTEFQAGAKRP